MRKRGDGRYKDDKTRGDGGDGGDSGSRHDSNSHGMSMGRLERQLQRSDRAVSGASVPWPTADGVGNGVEGGG
jgi:hypothetical protein